MRFLLAVLVAVLCLGCGAAAAPAAPPPSSSPPGQLAVADSGGTVHLDVGDRIEVALARQAGFSDWSHPTSTNPAVMAPTVDTHAAGVVGMTLAAFRATAAGTADLQSAAGAVCSPGTACPAIARAWQVHVVVA